jgi:hypothetical protein
MLEKVVTGFYGPDGSSGSARRPIKEIVITYGRFACALTTARAPLLHDASAVASETAPKHKSPALTGLSESG